MKFTLISTIALTIATVSSEASTMPWQCHSNCGKALTAYNKCKDSSNINSCLCGAKSAFNVYLTPCLDCGDTALYDYGAALQAPMKQCNMQLPTLPAGAQQKADSKTAEKKAKEEAKVAKKSSKSSKATKEAKKAIKKANEKKEKVEKKYKKYQKKLAEKGVSKAASAKRDWQEAKQEAAAAVAKAKRLATAASISYSG